MLYIKEQANSNGTHDNFQSSENVQVDGYLNVPLELEELALTLLPFVIITVADGVITNIEDNPVARIVPIEKLREDKLNSLNGMCSGTIYQGVDIGTLHYNFAKKTQVNLETIARLINEGRTTFLYRADNEAEQRTYLATEMSVIITAKSEWIAVNTNYYEQLKKWINRETDEAVINDIHYGSVLPNDLMQELVTKLSSIGIDITKYSSLMA